jgi:hypothetical protein
MRIFYTGIGCNDTFIHSEIDFLSIMNAEFTQQPKLLQAYQVKFKDWVLPDDFVFFTLLDWIEYSGADFIQ